MGDGPGSCRRTVVSDVIEVRHPGLSGCALEDVDRTGARQSHNVGHADLSPLDLTAAGLAAQVSAALEDVRDPGRAERVTLGQQPAGHVHRDLAVAPRSALVDPLARAAFRAEPQ